MARDSDACGLAELLAVIIGGSTQIEAAEWLLSRFGSIRMIAQAHVDEIARVPGIGNQTALRPKASLALGRKLRQPENDRPTIHSPGDAAQILLPLLAHRGQEYLMVMMLDTRNRVLDVAEVYRKPGSEISAGDQAEREAASTAASAADIHLTLTGALAAGLTHRRWTVVE